MSENWFEFGSWNGAYVFEKWHFIPLTLLIHLSNCVVNACVIVISTKHESYIGISTLYLYMLSVYYCIQLIILFIFILLWCRKQARTVHTFAQRVNKNEEKNSKHNIYQYFYYDLGFIHLKVNRWSILFMPYYSNAEPE